MTTRTWLFSAVAVVMLVGGWTVAARVAAPPPLRSAHSEPAARAPEDVVVTTEGKTFHRASCAFIHGPATTMAGGQAIARGYVPCTRCLPR